MEHRFFGKGHKLQYLIRWKDYSAANDTWEAAEQVFTPQLLEAYHRKHPKSQPFPHKRRAAAQGRIIRSSPISCQTTPATPLLNHQPPPASTSCSLFPRLRSPSTWIPDLRIVMSPHRHQPPRRHLRSPSSRRDASLPSPPSPSSRPSALEEVPTTLERLPRSPPVPSSSAHKPTKPPSNDFRGTSPSYGLKLPQPPSPPEPTLGPVGSYQTTADSRPSTSPTWGIERWPASSESARPTPPWPKEPWGGTGGQGSTLLPPRSPPTIRRLRRRGRKPNQRAPSRVALGPPVRI